MKHRIPLDEFTSWELALRFAVRRARLTGRRHIVYKSDEYPDWPWAVAACLNDN